MNVYGGPVMTMNAVTSTPGSLLLYDDWRPIWITQRQTLDSRRSPGNMA